MKLDIGCGPSKTDPACIGIDKRYCPGVDVVVDLERAALPYPTNSVDEVYANHLLEHIHNYIPLMEELFRVLRPGARLHVRVPHYQHESAFTDPTHVRLFTPSSFDFFDRDTILFRESGFLISTARFLKESVDVSAKEIRFTLSAAKHRILYVGPPESIHTRRWVGFLRNLGHAVEVAAKSKKGLATVGLGDILSSETRQRERVSARMRELAQGCDIVHAHFATQYGHLLEPVTAGTRKVLSVWGEDVLSEAQQCAAARERLITGLAVADAIGTTSRHLASVLERDYGVRPDRLWTFPWGYSQKLFVPHRPSCTRIVAELRIPENSPVVLSARVCRGENNIDRLVQAFVGSRIAACLVVLTGAIADRQYVQQVQASAASDKRVIVARIVNEEELADLYGRAAVTVSIPTVDQLCTTILESLACGTPVLRSDIPAYRERITPGINGTLVQPAATDGIVAGIEVLLNSCAGRSREAIAATVATDTFEENARSVVAMYDKPKDIS